MRLKDFLMKGVTGIALFHLFVLSLFCVACSESNDEEADEYANWAARNEAFFASLEDSLARGGTQWMKLKSYTKDAEVAGKNTDYIYVKVIENGPDTTSPMYTDSVRVSYEGRLIPTKNNPAGLVFESTAYGQYGWDTNASTKFRVSDLTEGWVTALLHMHQGDTWRIFTPHQLGYGTAGKSSSSSSVSIPGSSVLVFDLTLVNFSSVGTPMPAWSTRRR